MTWNVSISRSVERKTKKLPKEVREILAALVLDLRVEGPKPHGWISKPLKGRVEWSVRLKREWRAILKVRNQELVITVVKVAHRREVYD